LTNWAGNITFGAGGFHHPTTLPELQKLVAGSGHVRALGSGHSFNRIADSPGVLVSTAALPHVVEVAADRSTVTVSGGVRASVMEPLIWKDWAMAMGMEQRLERRRDLPQFVPQDFRWC